MSEPIKVTLSDEPAEPDHVHTQLSLIPGDPGEFEAQKQGILFDLGRAVRPEKKREDQPEMF